LLEVPGFLLSRHQDSVARFDDEGRLGVTILDRAPAELDGLAVTRGIWRVHFHSSGPIQPEISVQDPSASTIRGNTEMDLMISRETEQVNIQVSVAAGASAHLRSVQFVRLEPTAQRE
jgi:hypothetical protein